MYFKYYQSNTLRVVVLIIGLFCIPLFRFSLSKEIETLFEKLIKRLF